MEEQYPKNEENIFEVENGINNFNQKPLEILLCWKKVFFSQQTILSDG